MKTERLRKLAILDIDGTLTETSEVDAACYLEALKDCFGFSDIETDWSLYANTTDAGILDGIFQRRLNRSPSPDEIAAMQHRFLGYLQRAHSRNASAFSPVGGAKDFLTHLSSNKTWAPVIATGCWAQSAHFKLQAAGLAIKCPLISSDDAISREAILEKAIRTSQSFYVVESFSRVVSLGDGVWDLEAARRMILPFVGMARGARADRLRRLGATQVLSDFTDINEVFKALEEARTPEI